MLVGTHALLEDPVQFAHLGLVVVDEHGGTEGLVTVADLNSEIVGEEEDPQNPEDDLQQLQDDRWLVAGDLEIFELNRQLGLQLPEADGHHTLAGFLLERLQHIPAPGEMLRWKGHQFLVLAMDGPRIERVQIDRPLAEPITPGQTEAAAGAAPRAAAPGRPAARRRSRPAAPRAWLASPVTRPWPMAVWEEPAPVA